MTSIVKLRNIKKALTVGVPSESVSFILSGRISNFRIYKSFNFIDLIDGSTRDHLQVVVSRKLLKKPELGAYITCQGQIVTSKGPKQPLEFKVDEVKYLSQCDPLSYPLATSCSHTNDWYRKFPHLRPRAAHFTSMLRIKSELELSIHMIMKQMDFFRVHTPTLTSNDSEASSDLFLVERSKLHNHSLHGNKHSEKEEQEEEELEKDNRCLDIDDASQPESLYCLDNKKANESAKASEARRRKENLDNKKELEKEDKAEEGEGEGKEKLELREWEQKEEDEKQKRIVRDGYFNKDVFLITSAQLHLENLAGSLSRVYCISNTFRAENSISTRHLCEFLMFELEEANVSELNDLMNRAESIVKFIAQFLSEVSEQRSDFNSLVDKNLNVDIFRKLAESAYIRMSYEEALCVLRDKSDFIGDTRYGSDIGRLHERKLLDYTGNVPIFITNYPKQLKPFYMKCDANDKEAQCFDLIAAYGGELCGGSLREDSYEKLLANLNYANNNSQPTNANESKEEEKEIDVNKKASSEFGWYLDSRRYGSFPHAGFGMGVERLLQSLLGIKNIKDTTAFPRWTGHCPM